MEPPQWKLKRYWNAERTSWGTNRGALAREARVFFRQFTGVTSLATVGLAFALLLTTSAYRLGYAKAQLRTYEQPTPTVSHNERRVAAVRAYADSLGVDPELALAVSFVENWRGLPDAESHRGAVGIMQVRHAVWLGRFPECGAHLTDVTTNACYGVNVLRHYLILCTNNVACALRRYAGARSETKAQSYIAHVDARRPAAQAWLDQ